MSCSRPILFLSLQEYCFEIQDKLLDELDAIIQEPEKHQQLSKNTLKKKIDTYLKGFKMASPHELFRVEEDPDVSTCIMNSFEFLLEVLKGFDLPANYLEGGGHWVLWAKRKKEEQNENAKQRGILGKKKPKNKMKKGDEIGPDVQGQKGLFDVEPLFVALTGFLQASKKVRSLICDLFTTYKTQLLSLFCKENGELRSERCVDFDTILEFCESELRLELEEEIFQLTP